ncbi:uncharacterized protein PV09_07883 [Verruconis gallopava]|uniref:Uncharacterized protein n=1 Tax=Verruconis gallopava TaxID=253628 RepID=A0A0D2AN45_9PEZI|nr:uncharacterized protein PV09_07883 [Verruconis gallopava]KIW00524.1 hypothetical protein PV09_07883 [Verruconis gallopava]
MYIQIHTYGLHLLRNEITLLESLSQPLRPLLVRSVSTLVPKMIMNISSLLAFLSFSCLLVLAPALPTRKPSSRALVAQEPSTDPFYQPPAGFESTEPGTILKNRSINAAFFGVIPDPIEAYQLLYRTTAVNGSAIATVTTIFKPWGWSKKDRYISYHTAYDSSATICDPSYVFQYGSQQWGLIASLERILMEIYLFLGYLVVSPDYEGPDAAFPVGRLEGKAVLDGMRAVNNFASVLGFETNDPMIVGTGYSGGAIATGWAAALQPTYAPELNVKGWAQGGTPANLTGTLETIDGTVFAGFGPAAVVGLSQPSTFGAQLKPLINSIVTEAGAEALEFASQQCAVLDLLNFVGQSVQSTKFQSLGTGLLYNPIVADILEQCIIGLDPAETPHVPTFVYHAIKDEIIPYANASSMVNRWCSNGADLQFTTYDAGGHATTLVIALPAVVSFIENAFAGTTGLSGCTMNTELTNSLDPLALGLDLEPLLVTLVDALLVLGNDDENVINDIQILQQTIG